jgi:hypothetical protein
VVSRYVVPKQPSVKELRILNESTQFNFSKDANAFAATARSFQTSNEGSYRELTTSALRPEMLINIPLLLNVPGVAGVKIDFLDRSDQWMVNFYRTVAKAATEPKDSVVEKRRMNAQTLLKLKLAPAGGCAIRLVPAR